MPSSASPRIVAVAKDGFADGSTIFTSTLAPNGLLLPPTRNRTAASRFSVPQQTYAPDQCPGCLRQPARMAPHSTPSASARPATTPATADSPSGVIPLAPGPSENSS